MTTNQPTQTGITRATKRSKHPARSARIISSGIALASTLGISSAYTLAAQAKTTGEQIQNNSTVALAQNVLATVPGTSAAAVPAQPATNATAEPTQPAPAAIASATTATAAPATAAPAIAATASQAPVVVNIAPPAPQAQWTAPASQGSK